MLILGTLKIRAQDTRELLSGAELKIYHKMSSNKKCVFNERISLFVIRLELVTEFRYDVESFRVFSCDFACN